MVRILLVDDSAFDRQFAARILQDAGWNVEAAESGEAALEILNTRQVDLVVSDLVMPDMDGLQLLRRINQLESVVPVVIITSKGSEEVAVKALKRGAAGYVPKQSLRRDLRLIVTQVLDVSQSKDRRAEVVRECSEQKLRFVLTNRREIVPPVINYIQERIQDFALFSQTEVIRIGITLEESLTNSMIHGNLEVSSELRERDDDSYYELIRQRQQELPYRDRRVFIEARIDGIGVEFHIRDQGPGFDVSRVPDPTDPQSLFRASGRGILLMRSFMDLVEYNKKGNSVTLIKRKVVEQPDAP